MLIDEYDYKVLKRVEDITLTDYKIIEANNKEYLIPKDNLIALIEDLLAMCEHLKQEVDNE